MQATWLCSILYKMEVTSSIRCIHIEKLSGTRASIHSFVKLRSKQNSMGIVHYKFVKTCLVDCTSCTAVPSCERAYDKGTTALIDEFFNLNLENTFPGIYLAWLVIQSLNKFTGTLAFNKADKMLLRKMNEAVFHWILEISEKEFFPGNSPASTIMVRITPIMTRAPVPTKSCWYEAIKNKVE